MVLWHAFFTATFSLPLLPTINVVAESVIKNNTSIGIFTFIRTSFAYLVGKISDNLSPIPDEKSDLNFYFHTSLWFFFF